MPKAKRRNPIVPIPKAAEFHQAKSCGASKSHVNGDKPKSDDGAREHHAKGHSGGGRAAKRARSDAANSDGAQASKRPRSSGGSDASAGRGPRSGAPRRPQQQDPRQRPHKQGRPEGSASQHHPRHHHHSQQQPQHQWTPVSQVHQQAATAVGRLLEADASRRHGASLKSLTLAPHIVAKKATYAVTCQVLKFSRLLQQLDGAVGLSAGQPKLNKYTAVVLMYDMLRGQALRKGQAERAVLAAEADLRRALDSILREAGAKDMDDWLAKQGGGDGLGTGGGGEEAAGQAGGGGGGGSGPDVPHPRWVRVNGLKAAAAGGVEVVAWQLREHLRVGQASKAGSAAPAEAETEAGAGGKKGKKGKPAKPAAEREPKGQNENELVQVDPLLPDLLALPPGTALHDHPLVASGAVVLQSKASCMPAHALSPAPGWTVVDCCAAPGNKTTHLAAIMRNKGRVIAFDKDPKRLARLKANAERTGASCVQARLQDFLSIDPTDPEFGQVRGVLLDPSCSGSGTTFTRLDHLLPSHAAARHRARSSHGQAAAAAAAVTAAPQGRKRKPEGQQGGGGDEAEEVSEVEEVAAQDGDQPQALSAEAMEAVAAAVAAEAAGLEREEAARVAQLARFQATALSHALRFPALERLVYSTCSVHVAENEAVVAGALAQAAEAGLELADPFPAWHRRGLPLFPGAEKLVRTDAYLDGTDGFFVAVFQRRHGGGAGGGAGGQQERMQEGEEEDGQGQQVAVAAGAGAGVSQGKQGKGKKSKGGAGQAGKVAAGGGGGGAKQQQGGAGTGKGKAQAGKKKA
ncbi:hypothetical protein CHLRE_16g647602v5 [Chlamydomonas reinhardtii]|uniref:SAM-dependent MTase RsmB/NOP-type domain-containing protein n=1 Tax=Chlamydomonas reinhardtii TaxID=3055 RepID=A0A2K3CSN9_CHLRE|nr:uncharacterized protein CHLRE_16g647602v5 [Chlamydomonas reinhardtii]PNW71282.1 hypothetical protein CHLRE_16g647602v5 [Chlamydomonas reinhardtii]